MAKTRKLALMALLTAIALTIFVIENQIPAMKLLGKKEAGAVLLVRILMGAMFAGSPSTLLFSAAGGALAYLVMCLTLRFFGENQLWIVSALAGIAHNAGQLLACVLVVKTPGVLAYAPVLAASGVITGVFTGLAAQYLVNRLDREK